MTEFETETPEPEAEATPPPKKQRKTKVKAAAQPPAKIEAQCETVRSHVRIVNITGFFDGDGRELPPDPKNDEALRVSIARNGLLHPVIVTANPQAVDPEKDDYLLVAGRRRLKAAKELGWESIDVTVLVPYAGMDGDPQARTKAIMHAAQLAENTQRQQIDPLEEAGAFDHALAAGIPMAELATAHGVSETYIRQRKVLAELPPWVKAGFREKGWPLATLQLLTGLPAADFPEMKKMLAERPGLGNEPDRLRELLRAKTPTMEDALFTVEDYEKRDGYVIRDLFGGSTQVSSRQLYNNLQVVKASQLLGQIAETEGWVKDEVYHVSASYNGRALLPDDLHTDYVMARNVTMKKDSEANPLTDPVPLDHQGFAGKVARAASKAVMDQLTEDQRRSRRVAILITPNGRAFVARGLVSKADAEAERQESRARQRAEGKAAGTKSEGDDVNSAAEKVNRRLEVGVNTAWWSIALSSLFDHAEGYDLFARMALATARMDSGAREILNSESCRAFVRRLLPILGATEKQIDTAMQENGDPAGLIRTLTHSHDSGAKLHSVPLTPEGMSLVMALACFLHSAPDMNELEGRFHKTPGFSRKALGQLITKDAPWAVGPSWTPSAEWVKAHGKAGITALLKKAGLDTKGKTDELAQRYAKWLADNRYAGVGLEAGTVGDVHQRPVLI